MVLNLKQSAGYTEKSKAKSPCWWCWIRQYQALTVDGCGVSFDFRAESANRILPLRTWISDVPPTARARWSSSQLIGWAWFIRKARTLWWSSSKFAARRPPTTCPISARRSTTFQPTACGKNVKIRPGITAIRRRGSVSVDRQARKVHTGESSLNQSIENSFAAAGDRRFLLQHHHLDTVNGTVTLRLRMFHMGSGAGRIILQTRTEIQKERQRVVDRAPRTRSRPKESSNSSPRS